MDPDPFSFEGLAVSTLFYDLLRSSLTSPCLQATFAREREEKHQPSSSASLNQGPSFYDDDDIDEFEGDIRTTIMSQSQRGAGEGLPWASGGGGGAFGGKLNGRRGPYRHAYSSLTLSSLPYTSYPSQGWR